MTPSRVAKALVLTIAFAAMALLTACEPSGRSKFCDIPDARWEYVKSLELNPLEADSVMSGKLLLAVSHDADYPYSNLWLEVRYADGDSRIVTDTVNMTLADLYGRWLGKGFGSTYQVETPIATNVTLLRGKPLTVRHIMRVDTLAGIEKVGITIVP